MIKKRNIEEESRLRDIGEWLTYDLTAGAQNAFALSVVNPYTRTLIIDRVLVRVTTGGGTASATLDVDVDADGATGGLDIFEGIDISSSTTGLYDSLNDTDSGSGGDGKAIIWDKVGGTSPYLTAQILDAAAASLVGKVYVHVIEAQ